MKLLDQIPRQTITKRNVERESLSGSTLSRTFLGVEPSIIEDGRVPAVPTDETVDAPLACPRREVRSVGFRGAGGGGAVWMMMADIADGRESRLELRVVYQKVVQSCCRVYF